MNQTKVITNTNKRQIIELRKKKKKLFITKYPISSE